MIIFLLLAMAILLTCFLEKESIRVWRRRNVSSTTSNLEPAAGLPIGQRGLSNSSRTEEISFFPKVTARLVFISGLIFLVFLFFYAVTIDHGHVTQTQIPPSEKPPLEDLYDPGRILAQAKKNYAEWNYNAASEALGKLKSEDARGKDAQSIFVKSSEALKKQKLALAKEALISERRARVEYADQYEKAMLLGGQDVTIRAEGKDGRTIALTFDVINRSFVYQRMNDEALNARWKELGFTAVRLSDKFGQHSSYKL